MKETYVLHWHYDEHITKRIYNWVKQDKYTTEDTVLITENNKPMEILIPELVRDMGTSWYEHNRRKLYTFKWEEDIRNE